MQTNYFISENDADAAKASTLKPIFEKFNSICPVSKLLHQKLTECFQVFSIAKRKLLLKPGEQADHYYFVLKGILYSYYDNKGKLSITRITGEGQAATSVISFFRRVPGIEFIETHTDCVIAALSFDNLQFLLKIFPDLNFITRALYEQFAVEAEERLLMLQIGDLQDRISYFDKTYPGLRYQITDKMLAGFLNIRRETYNRKK
jgi:CRP/FNR family transcriptional regulator, anaerobic regulatory protein